MIQSRHQFMNTREERAIKMLPPGHQKRMAELVLLGWTFRYDTKAATLHWVAFHPMGVWEEAHSLRGLINKLEHVEA